MELIEALIVIRDECKKHDNCEECPLRDSENNACSLPTSSQSIYPCDWDLRTDYIAPRIFN